MTLPASLVLNLTPLDDVEGIEPCAETNDAVGSLGLVNGLAICRESVRRCNVLLSELEEAGAVLLPFVLGEVVSEVCICKGGIGGASSTFNTGRSLLLNDNLRIRRGNAVATSGIV